MGEKQGKMKPRMNVYLTTAKRVLGYSYPMIHSLFEENRDSEIYLYIVSENLSEEDITTEKKLAEQYGNHIIILHFDENMTRGKIVSASEHWPLGTLGCYWLFHELLPADVDRIIALESDAIVIGNLREFYDTDLEGFYAACPDSAHKPISHRELMKRLDGDVLTFVVSLYDVCKIRKDFSIEQIIETDQFVIKEFGHSQQELTFGILFKGKIKFLPAQNLCVEENRQSMEAMGFDYLLKCEDTCKVLHFSSTGEKEKPWNPTFVMPGYLKWWEYARKSPYYNEYFSKQWELYERVLWERQILEKNKSTRNILSMTLILLWILVLMVCFILRVGTVMIFVTVLLLPISFLTTLAVRFVLMKIT